MDIWERLYQRAKEQYRPCDVSPFISAHHVSCALEAESGEIFTGFCIEGASGVIALCAERVAALDMYHHSGQTKVKRLLVCRENPPKEEENPTPCGACREFFMQLNEENENMEILLDYESRKTVTLKELMLNWWGKKRYQENK